MKKRISALLLASVMLLGLMAGCSGSAEPTAEAPAEAPAAEAPAAEAPAEAPAEGAPADAPAAGGETIVWGMTSLWANLTPFANGSGYYSSIISSFIYDHLVYVSYDGVITPRAADSWEMSEDGKTLTFKLNENATFHDGSAVHASDWVFAMKLLSKAGTGFADAGLISMIEGTDDSGIELSDGSLAVSAPDDYTLEIKFKNTTNLESFLMSSAYVFTALPEALLKDVPAEDIVNNEWWNAPVGSGPAKFESQVAGSELTLARYDGYYLGEANWGKMVFKATDASAAATAMMTGEIDIAYSPISNDEALELEGTEGVTVNMIDEPTQVYTLVFNNQKVTDLRVRQAVNLAIDKELIANQLLLGLALPMETFMSPSSEYYPESLEYSFDTAAAKELLDQAMAEGYDGHITIAAPEAGGRANMAVLVQQNLEAAGFTVEVVTIDAATMMSDMKNGAEGQYDCGIIIFGIAPDPMSLNNYFTATGSSVFSLTDPSYEDYQSRINAEQDAAARTALVKEYLEYIHTEAPAAFLAGKKQYYAYSAKLGDVTADLIAIARRNVPIWNWVVG